MEHRWGQRIILDMPIHITAANAAVMMRGRVANLSITGALIKADFRPRVLSRVQIVFGSSQSRDGDVLSLTAYVARNYRYGIGVEWCDWASPSVADLIRASSAMSQNVQYARVLNLSDLRPRAESPTAAE